MLPHQANAVNPAQLPQAPRRPGRPLGSKNKPKVNRSDSMEKALSGFQGFPNMNSNMAPPPLTSSSSSSFAPSSFAPSSFATSSFVPSSFVPSSSLAPPYESLALRFNYGAQFRQQASHQNYLSNPSVSVHTNNVPQLPQQQPQSQLYPYHLAQSNRCLPDCHTFSTEFNRFTNRFVSASQPSLDSLSQLQHPNGQQALLQSGLQPSMTQQVGPLSNQLPNTAQAQSHSRLNAHQTTSQTQPEQQPQQQVRSQIPPYYLYSAQQSQPQSGLNGHQITSQPQPQPQPEQNQHQSWAHYHHSAHQPEPQALINQLNQPPLTKQTHSQPRLNTNQITSQPQSQPQPHQTHSQFQSNHHHSAQQSQPQSGLNGRKIMPQPQSQPQPEQNQHQSRVHHHQSAHQSEPNVLINQLNQPPLTKQTQSQLRQRVDQIAQQLQSKPQSNPTQFQSQLIHHRPTQQSQHQSGLNGHQITSELQPQPQTHQTQSQSQPIHHHPTQQPESQSELNQLNQLPLTNQHQSQSRQHAHQITPQSQPKTHEHQQNEHQTLPTQQRESQPMPQFKLPKWNTTSSTIRQAANPRVDPEKQLQAWQRTQSSLSIDQLGNQQAYNHLFGGQHNQYLANQPNFGSLMTDSSKPTKKDHENYMKYLAKLCPLTPTSDTRTPPPPYPHEQFMFRTQSHSNLSSSSSQAQNASSSSVTPSERVVSTPAVEAAAPSPPAQPLSTTSSSSSSSSSLNQPSVHDGPVYEELTPTSSSENLNETDKSKIISTGVTRILSNSTGDLSRLAPMVNRSIEVTRNQLINLNIRRDSVIKSTKAQPMPQPPPQQQSSQQSVDPLVAMPKNVPTYSTMASTADPMHVNYGSYTSEQRMHQHVLHKLATNSRKNLLFKEQNSDVSDAPINASASRSVDDVPTVSTHHDALVMSHAYLGNPAFPGNYPPPPPPRPVVNEIVGSKSNNFPLDLSFTDQLNQIVAPNPRVVQKKEPKRAYKKRATGTFVQNQIPQKIIPNLANLVEHDKQRESTHFVRVQTARLDSMPQQAATTSTSVQSGLDCGNVNPTNKKPQKNNTQKNVPQFNQVQVDLSESPQQSHNPPNQKNDNIVSNADLLRLTIESNKLIFNTFPWIMNCFLKLPGETIHLINNFYKLSHEMYPNVHIHPNSQAAHTVMNKLLSQLPPLMLAQVLQVIQQLQIQATLFAAITKDRLSSQPNLAHMPAQVPQKEQQLNIEPNYHATLTKSQSKSQPNLQLTQMQAQVPPQLHIEPNLPVTPTTQRLPSQNDFQLAQMPTAQFSQGTSQLKTTPAITFPTIFGLLKQPNLLDKDSTEQTQSSNIPQQPQQPQIAFPNPIQTSTQPKHTDIPTQIQQHTSPVRQITESPQEFGAKRTLESSTENNSSHTYAHYYQHKKLRISRTPSEEAITLDKEPMVSFSNHLLVTAEPVSEYESDGSLCDSMDSEKPAVEAASSSSSSSSHSLDREEPFSESTSSPKLDSDAEPNDESSTSSDNEEPVDGSSVEESLPSHPPSPQVANSPLQSPREDSPDQEEFGFEDPSESLNASPISEHSSNSSDSVLFLYEIPMMPEMDPEVPEVMDEPEMPEIPEEAEEPELPEEQPEQYVQPHDVTDQPDEPIHEIGEINNPIPSTSGCNESADGDAPMEQNDEPCPSEKDLLDDDDFGDDDDAFAGADEVDDMPEVEEEISGEIVGEIDDEIDEEKGDQIDQESDEETNEWEIVVPEEQKPEALDDDPELEDETRDDEQELRVLAADHDPGSDDEAIDNDEELGVLAADHDPGSDDEAIDNDEELGVLAADHDPGSDDEAIDNDEELGVLAADDVPELEDEAYDDEQELGVLPADDDSESAAEANADDLEVFEAQVADDNQELGIQAAVEVIENVATQTYLPIIVVEPTKTQMPPPHRATKRTLRQSTRIPAKKPRIDDNDDDGDYDRTVRESVPGNPGVVWKEDKKAKAYNTLQVLSKRLNQNGGLDYLLLYKGSKYQKIAYWTDEKDVEGSKGLISDFEAFLKDNPVTTYKISTMVSEVHELVSQIDNAVNSHLHKIFVKRFGKSAAKDQVAKRKTYWYRLFLIAYKCFLKEYIKYSKGNKHLRRSLTLPPIEQDNVSVWERGVGSQPYHLFRCRRIAYFTGIKDEDFGKNGWLHYNETKARMANERLRSKKLEAQKRIEEEQRAKGRKAQGRRAKKR